MIIAYNGATEATYFDNEKHVIHKVAHPGKPEKFTRFIEASARRTHDAKE